MTTPQDEHDDDLRSEVHEGDSVEIERFPQVSEDLEDAEEESALDSDRDPPDTYDDTEEESPDAI